MPVIAPSTIASWPTPNYANPKDHGPVLYAVFAVFFTIATLAVGIRLYTRVAVRRWVGLDDGFIVLAYVSRSNLYCR